MLSVVCALLLAGAAPTAAKNTCQPRTLKSHNSSMLQGEQGPAGVPATIPEFFQNGKAFEYVVTGEGDATHTTLKIAPDADYVNELQV